MSENIFQRWDETGLLNNLPEEDKPKFAQLLENQFVYINRVFGERDLSQAEKGFESVCFALVRRIFTSLEFDWDVVDRPCFEFEGREMSVNTERLIADFNFVLYKNISAYSAMDLECLLVSDLSCEISQELNKRYKDKRVFFFTPLAPLGRVQEEEGDVLKLGFRAKEVG